MAKRIYGIDETHITLTDKARAYHDKYSNTTIYEYDEPDGTYTYTYRIPGDGETMWRASADQLNRCFEHLYDQDEMIERWMSSAKEDK